MVNTSFNITVETVKFPEEAARWAGCRLILRRLGITRFNHLFTFEVIEQTNALLRSTNDHKKKQEKELEVKDKQIAKLSIQVKNISAEVIKVSLPSVLGLPVLISYPKLDILSEECMRE